MTVDLGNDVEQIAVGLAIALITAVFVGVWRLFKRIDKQDNDIAWIKELMAREFGGNSGGMREAINRLDQKVDDRIDDVSDRLDSHISQHVGNGMRETA